MSGIYEQRETSSGQRALSTMLSTLPVTPVLDLQLVKAEQIPQCLCLTELLTGVSFFVLDLVVGHHFSTQWGPT